MAKPKIRLYIDCDYSANLPINLAKNHVHYLTNVMRIKNGDNILLFNGKNGLWKAEINFSGKNSCQAILIEQTEPQYSEPDIWLYFAPVKNAPLNYIIQKTVELGVAGLQPIITQNTIVDKINKERMGAIIIETAEQCQRLTIPKINHPEKLNHVLANWDKKRQIILCNEKGMGLPPHKALQNIDSNAYAIFIGPEGGFSNNEFISFSALSDVINISLGPRILRADSAAIVALACCQMIIGDWDKKPCF